MGHRRGRCHAGEVAYVELGYPADLLKNHVVLVDTPGVNDLNEQRAEVTYGYVPRADAVVFLLDASQALKDSEREFLRSRVLESARDRLIFVLGKIDMLSVDERAAVLDYVTSGLGTMMPDPVIFALSAKDWARSKDPASGMPELMAYLGRFLARDRAQVILDNAAADAARTAGYLENNLGVRMYAYDLDLGELEQRIASVRDQLDTSKRKLDDLHGRIDAEASSIKNHISLDLEAFTARSSRRCPPSSTRTTPTTSRPTCRRSSRTNSRRGPSSRAPGSPRCSSTSPRKSSRSPTRTSRAAAALLADRLGPGDTAVEISVDSFKYDVGIYAVGALGTTVMLFVNALAGGLLTLAAPILAIVLKSKIAGDIRVQAKEKVPAAILNAAEAMGPHFDRCIDDFGKRLSEFVANAGNTLYKGISEIPRSHDGRAPRSRQRPGPAQVRHHRADPADPRGRQRLRQLREGLWAPDEPLEPAPSVAELPPDVS